MIREAHILSLFLVLALLPSAGCGDDAGFSGGGRAPGASGRGRTAGASDKPADATAVDESEVAGANRKSTATDTSTDDGKGDDANDDGEPVRIESEFEVAPLTEGKVEFDFTRGVFEQSVELANDYAAVSKDFSQIVRPAYSKLYYQGTVGKSITDSDKQNEMGVLDLVVVIDNSGSMSQEQANLSTKLAPLLEYVNTSDWAINVVTTDPTDGCTRQGIIRKGAANAASAFQAAIEAGTKGDGNERGILQAVNALKCPQVMGFPRPNSSVAVLIVADEDNCSSNGGGCGTDPWNTHTYLTSFLQSDLGRALGKDARVYGIFWHPDTPVAECSTGLNVATQYAKAVNDTGGVYGSICSSDYTATLRRVSQDMATILKSQMVLSADPDPGTIVVKVNGAVKTSGWSVAGRIVTFTDIPPFAATVDVTYTVGAKPIKTRFPLGQRPALDTVGVQVGGATVGENGYAIDATSNELVFATPPPDNAEIAVTFRAEGTLSSEFPLGAPVRDGTLELTVDNAPATGFTVSAEGVVMFATPPPDGAAVSAKFETFKAKRLDYPVALVGHTIKSLTVVDADTGDAVKAVYQSGILSIDEGDHVEGRSLLVRYENEASGVKQLELAELPEGGSVTFEGAPQACVGGLTVEGKQVTYTCDFSSEQIMTIHYQYRAAPTTTFVVDGIDEPETGVWQVFVDGVETKAYERQAKAIALIEQPLPSAIVKIVWTGEL